MYKYCVIVLAILASLEILVSEGRPIKSTKPHEPEYSYEKESKRESTKYSPTSQIGDSTNTADDFRPTTPGSSTPAVGRGEEEEVGEKYKSLGTASHKSIAGAKDDFRPTGPGHSPGVGHSLQLEDADEKSVQDSVTGGDNNDFRPTEPGHSPGAGHSRNFVTGGAKEDFRPTGPGHSPGVGHLLVEEDKHSAIAGGKDDFRPTDPGHSPGIGHH